MKRILSVLLLSAMIVSYVAPIVGHGMNLNKERAKVVVAAVSAKSAEQTKTNKTNESNRIKALGVTADGVLYNPIELDVVDVAEVTSPNPLEENETEEEIVETEEVIEEEYVPCPEPETKPTIYNTYTESELHLLYMVVEAEATGKGFEAKCNVASVIFNRVATGWGTLKEVLNPDQFTPLSDGRAYKVEITDETIAACEYVFENGDTTYGAIYFNTKGLNSWAERNKEKVHQDDVHYFYSNEDKE